MSSPESDSTRHPLQVSKPRSRRPCLETSLAPLQEFQLPEEIAQRAPDLVEDVKAIQERLRVVLEEDSSTRDKSACIRFVDEIHRITQDQSRVCKRARVISNELFEADKKKRKMMNASLVDQENDVLRTRSQLSSGAERIANNVFAQTQTTLMADAFLNELLMNRRVQWPAASPVSFDKYVRESGGRKRSSKEQSEFKRLLMSTYSDRNVKETDETMVWCPVLGLFLDEVIAAHIIPVSLKPYNVAYLFGVSYDDAEAWQLMMSAQNGLMLTKGIEKAMDSGYLVIVPMDYDNPTSNYQAIVLVRSMMKNPIEGTKTLGTFGQYNQLQFQDIHRKELQWTNDNRPSRTHLYVRYLFTRWIRKRVQAEDYEQDVNLFPSKAWADIEPLRQGVLRKLAHEIGDYIPEEEEDNSMNIDQRADYRAATEISHSVIEYYRERLG